MPIEQKYAAVYCIFTGFSVDSMSAMDNTIIDVCVVDGLLLKPAKFPILAATFKLKSKIK